MKSTVNILCCWVGYLIPLYFTSLNWSVWAICSNKYQMMLAQTSKCFCEFLRLWKCGRYCCFLPRGSFLADVHSRMTTFFKLKVINSFCSVANTWKIIWYGQNIWRVSASSRYWHREQTFLSWFQKWCACQLALSMAFSDMVSCVGFWAE